MKQKNLSVKSDVRTLELKYYAEQLGLPGDTTPDQIRQKLNEIIERIKNDNSKTAQNIIIVAIVHDRDYLGDDFFTPSIEKPHVHMYIRFRNGFHTHISQILDLLEVEFRMEEDKTLLEHGAINTIRDFARVCMYITHDTEQAIAEGKAHYELDEIITNVLLEEIIKYREGYVAGAHNININELEILDACAFKLGYELGNYEKWYDTLTINQRKLSSMKIIKESYDRGVYARIREDSHITRLAMYIQGAPDVGKSFQAEKIKGEKIKIDIGKTGKFDELKPYHRVMIINDAKLGKANLLNLADNMIAHPYRRNSGNTWWCGEILIITNNKPFDEYINEVDTCTKEEMEALRSRFYLAHIEKSQLVIDKASTRGTIEEQIYRKNLAREVKAVYDEGLKEYNELSNNSIVYDDIYGLDVDVNQMFLDELLINTRSHSDDTKVNQPILLNDDDEIVGQFYFDSLDMIVKETLGESTNIEPNSNTIFEDDDDLPFQI